MKTRYFSIFLAFALLIVNCQISIAQKQLYVLHSSDTHSRIDPIDAKQSTRNANMGGVARRAGFVNQFRQQHPNMLLFDCGDISATSFHATKLLNTSEGGGIFTKDPDIDERLRELRFFGYNSAKDVVRIGTNAKMTEVNAAIGLANLKLMDEIIADRRLKYGLYKEILSAAELGFQRIDDSCNCSYFPVIFKTEDELLDVDVGLKQLNIFARRYFWPSVNTYKKACLSANSCPISEDIANRILCLPLYYSLSIDDVKAIARNVTEIIG